MTTTIDSEVSRRLTQGAQQPLTRFADDLQRELRAMLQRTTRLRFPDSRYQRDPVGFFHNVLGLEPWRRQVEIIEAVRDNMRVAICSGHKVGKSATVAGLALWFFCSFKDARVILSSTTSRQVDQILWRELRMMRARSGRCLECKRVDPDGHFIPRPCPHSAIIEGEQGELARTGLQSDDFREVVGFTAREAEAVAGISGQNLLYLLDEASGIPDIIYEAIEGNRAGGARVCLVGNGTRNEGEFFNAFTTKAHLYKTLRISSEESPNVVQGAMVIPGLATREWIQEKRAEWGENSALYLVRVKGQHAVNEEGRIFSLHEIAEAERRWHDTPEAGCLFIGIDPAGESGSGDETVFCARRGLRMLLLRAMLGLSAEQHRDQLLALLPTLRVPREKAVVVIDGDGSVGARLSGILRAYLDDKKHANEFELVVVRGGEKAIRQPKVYDRRRDELAANLKQWFEDGGAILEDTKLARELHVLEWRQRVDQRLKVTDKVTLRKLLGRSPDRYDALALSVWEPRSLLNSEIPDSAKRLLAQEQHELVHAAQTLDPWAGAAVWQR